MFRQIRIAATCTSAALCAAALLTPVAQADINFVECSFSVPKPYVYNLNGEDYVGTTVVAKDCRTNLGSTPMDVKMDINVSNELPDGTWKANTISYVATHDVRNGDTFTLTFPNDNRLIPLRPGGYLASATAISSVPGYAAPLHIDAEMFAWGVPNTPT